MSALISSPSLALARTILAKHGIGPAWSPNAIRVAVVARLPKSQDRRQFNFLADKCGTHEELIELAAATLEAFKRRQTPLLPPPLGKASGGTESGKEEETLEELQAPYTVR